MLENITVLKGLKNNSCIAFCGIAYILFTFKLHNFTFPISIIKPDVDLMLS